MLFFSNAPEDYLVLNLYILIETERERERERERIPHSPRMVILCPNPCALTTVASALYLATNLEFC